MAQLIGLPAMQAAGVVRSRVAGGDATQAAAGRGMVNQTAAMLQEIYQKQAQQQHAQNMGQQQQAGAPQQAQSAQQQVPQMTQQQYNALSHAALVSLTRVRAQPLVLMCVCVTSATRTDVCV